MPQVVLFRPPEFYSKALANIRPPLGLLQLAAALKQAGFTVAVIDTAVTPDWHPLLAEAMDETTVPAGAGVMTGWQIRGALEFSQSVRDTGCVPVVWGGLHPSLLPEQTLAHPLVDIVATGEGEELIVSLVRALADGQRLDTVKNIGFKRDGQIVLTEQVDGFLDMNRLPAPAYECVHAEYYARVRQSFSAALARCLDLNTSRGCPFRCGFCYNLAFNCGKWRGMDATGVLDATDDLVKRYRLGSVNFVADNFCVNKQRVRDICQGLIDRGLDIQWHTDMRIDTFLKYEDDLLEWMKRSGCRELTFGVESGSSVVLQQICKAITVQQVLDAHGRARKLGFDVSYHFMIGFPDETRADVAKTIDLILTLSRDPSVKILGPSVYIPYPGTSLFDRCVAKGFKPPTSLEEWISYDWEAASKLPWLTRSDRRYLEAVKFLVTLSVTRRRDPPARMARAWARFRAKTFVAGLDHLAIDVWRLKAFRKLLRR